MKSNTYKTLERISVFQYELILEGIGIGGITGLVVSLFRIFLEKADGYREVLLVNLKNGNAQPWIGILILVGLYLLVVAALKIEPLSSGSGIPQVKGELQGQVEQCWWKVILAKFVGGIAAIGAGLSLGREGPSIQLGAMVGKGFSQLTRRLKTEEKMLMTCGAGAGLAGAFCAPLAGVVFSLEELHKNFSTDVLLSTMGAVVASDFISSYIFGLRPVFNLAVESRLPLSRYWLVIVLGIILGVFGVIYNKSIEYIQKGFDKICGKKRRLAIVFLMSGVLAMTYPLVLGSGHGLVRQVAEGHYLVYPLMALLALKFIFSIASFGSGAPGGIFLPLLVMGAMIGGIIAQLFGSITGYNDLYLPNFVILGMAGYFSAIVRAPITGVILITEMTGDFNNLLSLAVVSLVAYVIADILKGIPIYDQLLKRMLLSSDEDEEEFSHHKVIIQSEVYHGSKMDGEKIEKMLLPQGSLIVTVIRDGKEIIPRGNTVLKGADKMEILCNEGKIKVVEEKLEAICKSVYK